MFLQDADIYVPHGVTTQKTNIDILTAVKISDLIMKNIVYLRSIEQSTGKLEPPVQFYLHDAGEQRKLK
jgi:hypothetical protein